MQAYQALYRELFALIEAGEAFSAAADELRRRMDRARGSKDEKQAWGEAAGWPLYRQARYGE